ncbi:MAG: SEC-C domain-containing protein [Lachnospiraceae bacterium]|nr:SEC-C domain-containing protein [Lachnospiraceae bacterium]
MSSEKSLLTQWREYAYTQETNTKQGQMFWQTYFTLEQGIYEKLLASSEVVTGTVQELADKYDVELSMMVGFLDGINESLVKENPIDDMTADTVVSLEYDKEKLYYNMVAARAEWLYNLPAWDDLLSKERRQELYREQKKSGTIVREKKIGRNDPCPCGSGKKYKFCCGKAK